MAFSKGDWVKLKATKVATWGPDNYAERMGDNCYEVLVTLDVEKDEIEPGKERPHVGIKAQSPVPTERSVVCLPHYAAQVLRKQPLRIGVYVLHDHS